MMTPVDTCRCCGSSRLFRYLDLGLQPLANSYVKEVPEHEPHFPLQVDYCEVCSHSQLSVVVDPDLMYRNYLYVSGTTETFRKHQQALAEDAVRRVLQRDGAPLTVLDIAANDASQLAQFKELGCAVWGVDPARNLQKLSHEKGIRVVCGYWGSELAEKIASGNQSFIPPQEVGGPDLHVIGPRLPQQYDIITATNVFAHVADPLDFLLGCKEVLSKQGKLFIEFPYGNRTVKECQFDQIYHEHLSYFTVRSMAYLVDRAGLVIEDIVETPIHGGSIRFVIRRPEERQGWEEEHGPVVWEKIEAEIYDGLSNLETYQAYAEAVEKNRADLKELVYRLRLEGYQVLGYGASAKGNTMLNYFGIQLDAIVDDNPLKHDYLTPGTHTPIVAPTFLIDRPGKLAYVVLSWNFWKEIKSRIQRLRPNQYQDLLVSYVPQVACEGLFEG